MSHYTKYVIVEFGEFGVAQPFLFSERASHQEVAYRLASTFEGIDHSKILGAGFCGKDLETGRWHVWGKSVGLKMESTPEDEAMINRCFGIDD